VNSRDAVPKGTSSMCVRCVSLASKDISLPRCASVCMCVCVRERGCVCVREVCLERHSSSSLAEVCVCVCGRKREDVCVCVSEKKCVSKETLVFLGGVSHLRKECLFPESLLHSRKECLTLEKSVSFPRVSFFPLPRKTSVSLRICG